MQEGQLPLELSFLHLRPPQPPDRAARPPFLKGPVARSAWRFGSRTGQQKLPPVPNVI